MAVRRHLLAGAFILFSVLSATCGTSHPLREPTIEPALLNVAVLMLTESDVPETWIDKGEYYDQEIVGADALRHEFRPDGVSETSLIKVDQVLSVFSDNQAAEKAFVGQSQIYAASPHRFHLQELQTYQSTADRFQFVCEDTNNGVVKICWILQLHSNKLSHILAGIDGQYITQEQVEQIIERVDMKLSTN